MVAKSSDIIQQTTKRPIVTCNLWSWWWSLCCAQKKAANAHIDQDTFKYIPLQSAGSTVVVQWEAEGPWMYETIVGCGSDEHNGRGYKIWLTKVRHIITRTKDACQVHSSHRQGIPVKRSNVKQCITGGWQNQLTFQWVCSTIWKWEAPKVRIRG